MFQKPTFEENIYMKIIRWAYLLLIVNVFFVILNIPFTLSALFLSLVPGNALIFWASLIFLGPGIIGVFYCADEFYKNKDLTPFKDFLSGLKKFFVKGLMYWGIFLLVLLISAVDIVFFYQTSLAPFMVAFFVILLIFTLALSLNCFYFQMRNPNSSFRDIFRISLYYVLKKWYVSLINVVLVMCLLAMMILKPQFGLLITPSIFLGIIYLNCRKLHQK